MKKNLIVEIDKELHQKFKILSTQLGVSMKELVTKCIKELIQNYKNKENK